MGYAKLYFNNNGANTVTHVLHDIVGVITGTYTTTSQLTVATPSMSEIVNTQNSNWSFLYPATHGAKGNTNVSWVLTAPCVSSNTKLKYVRISNGGARGSSGIDPGGTALYQTTLYNGVRFTAATAATSNTVVSNESYYINNNGNDVNTSNPYTDYDIYSHFTGNYITLSWSQRHLLIFGQIGGAGGIASVPAGGQFAFAGCFETTETSVSTYRNTAPFIFFLRGMSRWVSGYDPGSTNYVSSTITGPTGQSGFYSGYNTLYDVFLQYNHYNPTTTTISGIYNILGDINSQKDDMTLLADSSSSVSIPNTFTKTSTGQTATYLEPIFYHQHHIGIPHMYISNLSNVYRVPNNIGNNFDTFTVGADTYVYLKASGSSGSYPAGGFALVVKKS